MRVQKYLILILLFCLITNGFGNEKALKKSFETYRTAIIRGNGELASMLIDQTTVRYYDRIVEMALYGGRAEVNNLSIGEKVLVLKCRHLISLDTLKTFKGADLFQYQVDNEWFDRTQIASLAITDVRIKGRTASSRLLRGGQLLNYGYLFNVEDGIWKLDLTAGLEVVDRDHRTAARQSGLDENHYAMQLLKDLSGERVGLGIWAPPLRKQTAAETEEASN